MTRIFVVVEKYAIARDVTQFEYDSTYIVLWRLQLHGICEPGENLGIFIQSNCSAVGVARTDTVYSLVCNSSHTVCMYIKQR